jgi:hypothetical protein
MWQVQWDYYDRRRVVPLDDLGKHTLALYCKCKPHEDDGIIVHSSFDGRELVECGERKSS